MFAFDKGMAPDLPEYGHPFLVKARNAYAGVLGYEPIKSLAVLTAGLPTGCTWKGSGAFQGLDGTVALIAGTNGSFTLATTGNTTNANNVIASVANTTGLIPGMSVTGTGIPASTTISSISGSNVTISNNATATATGVALTFSGPGLFRLTSTTATDLYLGTYTAPWFFGQFGDKVVCVNGAAPLKYTISSGLAATLGGSPPNASYVAIVRDFVFLAGNSSNQNRLYWSSINNAEAWTIGTAQCDIQDLPDGGAITGLAGGEFGLVFQDRAIHLFEYVGTPTIFTRRKVANNVGALCHGGIAQHDRKYFFYSRRGFYKYIDGEVIPIGRNKVDRTFRNTYSTQDISNNLRCAIDPERSLVIWAMQDKLWVYNWDNDMWSDVAITGIVGISTGQTASLTLEDIAVTFPSIENVTPDFDNPFWRGGSPLLMIAQTDGALYTFGNSVNLQAEFRLPQLELNPGRESLVRNTLITGNSNQAIVSIDCRARMADTPTNTVSTDLRANGDVPIRCSGRYIQPEVIYPSTAVWTSIEGVDIEASPGGRR